MDMYAASGIARTVSWSRGDGGRPVGREVRRPAIEAVACACPADYSWGKNRLRPASRDVPVPVPAPTSAYSGVLLRVMCKNEKAP